MYKISINSRTNSQKSNIIIKNFRIGNIITASFCTTEVGCLSKPFRLQEGSVDSTMLQTQYVILDTDLHMLIRSGGWKNEI